MRAAVIIEYSGTSSHPEVSTVSGSEAISSERGTSLAAIADPSSRWTYSAPPLKLNSRGWGEACVWAGFALIAIGADFVQRGQLSTMPLVAVASYALLVTDVLFINQFPDRKADEAAGKHHWVVRLGPLRARWVYGLFAAAAYAWLAGAVLVGALPSLAPVALVPAVLSAKAARDVVHLSATPSDLAPAIQRTIGAATLHGLLLAAAITASRAFG